tara:strand:+ start:115 stop:303 length:189 start_codon:yes stop_codon:yes gene_type:complete
LDNTESKAKFFARAQNCIECPEAQAAIQHKLPPEVSQLEAESTKKTPNKKVKGHEPVSGFFP